MAYDILVEIGHVLGDEERGGNKENMHECFDKANLGLLKVLVVKLQAEWLKVHLQSMLEGLLKWQNSTKNHFKAKVKLLLGMLVTKCGLGAVKGVMLEEHMKLLTNICKISSNFSEKNLPEHLTDESDDEPLELLDRQRTRSAMRSREHLKRKSRSKDDEVELDSDGRLIIREKGKQRKEKLAKPEYDARSEPDTHLSGKSVTKVQKRRKTSDSGWAYTGKEYDSKKMMSRQPRQRAAARKGMASVVKMTRKFEGKSASGVLSMKSLKLKKKGRVKKI
ncbi:hypothetical protein PIB30_077078 [Stylosanthes scabra]|uniref:RRP12-like protein n=1 Tax=Stylosanthes scabra TaxID=79078 RepID=A0ABU6ZP34_9FABA|nr:hypothetical protein [Stylosanthes scabra]